MGTISEREFLMLRALCSPVSSDPDRPDNDTSIQFLSEAGYIDMESYRVGLRRLCLTEAMEPYPLPGSSNPDEHPLHQLIKSIATSVSSFLSSNDALPEHQRVSAWQSDPATVPFFNIPIPDHVKGDAATAEGIGGRPEPDSPYVFFFQNILFDILSKFIHRSDHSHFLQPILADFRCGPAGSHAPGYFVANATGFIESQPTPAAQKFARNIDPFRALFLCDSRAGAFGPARTQIEWKETAIAAAFFSSRAMGMRAAKQAGVLDPDYEPQRSVLLFTQYDLQLSVVLARYEPEWLEYVLAGDKPVMEEGLEDRHFLWMHRMGLYDLKDVNQVYRLAAMLAAVLLKDAHDAKREM